MEFESKYDIGDIVQLENGKYHRIKWIYITSNKKGYIVLDQIRTIDKIRLIKKLGNLNKKDIKQVKQVIKEMLVD